VKNKKAGERPAAENSEAPTGLFCRLFFCVYAFVNFDKSIIERAAKPEVNNQLPAVAFHSLRHASTTYKLKLNKGDIKATQGDTGHAQADMVMRVYAHIWMKTARSTP
jgi:integrase